MQLAKKTKYMWKTVKHFDKKLKDAKAAGNNEETGGGERPKHTGLKPTDAEPTSEKLKLTTKITLGSAVGGGMSKGSTNGAGTRFGAAGAAAGSVGKAGSSWSAIANKAGGGCSA